jgi:ABC-2 type transport system permease protein
LIWGIFNFVQVLLATVILSLIFPLKLNLSWFSLLVFIVNFFAIVGFSMIFSGLTLKFTKTASFNAIIEYVLLFASGSLIPLSNMPSVLKFLAAILPMNLGLKLSQAPFSLAPFLLLLTQAVVYLLIGSLAFQLVFQSAKKEGLNTRY